jgi:hypothetical protein
MTKLITKEEILKMRVEVNERTADAKPPKGREYWDVERIVATLEHLQLKRRTKK